MDKNLSGSCLCGSVSYECSEEHVMSAHCACVDCRKSSGTSHCTHVVMNGNGVVLRGEVQSFAKPADSGNIVNRHFCGTCGSAVYSTNSSMPGMVFLRASSLDDLNAIEPSMFVYASRAPEWLRLPNDMTSFEEMPPAAPADIIEEARSA